ncbi:hypothetical protein HDU90_008929 [Geranomyces variabilis]|nr:hypothetical protein HDU90_008929 [Geranomyces variabilis]
MGGWSAGTMGIMTNLDQQTPFGRRQRVTPDPNGQVWLARVSTDLNSDGTSDLVLQCTSYIGTCGPSESLYSYTIVWYLNSVGKVISSEVLTTPSGLRLALGILIYRGAEVKGLSEQLYEEIQARLHGAENAPSKKRKGYLDESEDEYGIYKSEIESSKGENEHPKRGQADRGCC